VDGPSPVGIGYTRRIAKARRRLVVVAVRGLSLISASLLTIGYSPRYMTAAFSMVTRFMIAIVRRVPDDASAARRTEPGNEYRTLI
jgi:hypothetical protein